MAKHFQVDTGSTLTTNLVAYYKLEDVNDYYGAFTLTNTNTVAFNAGKISNAANFGSANTNKNLTTTNTLGINGGAISLACWVNITTAPASGNFATIVQQDNNSSIVQYDFYYQNNAGTLRLDFWRYKVANGLEGPSYNVTLTPGTWYHLVFTYDGTNIRGYVNGSLVAGPTTASGTGSGSLIDGFRIGSTIDDALYLSGLVDECGVWTKALSTTEITDLYNSGSGQTMVDSAIKTINGLALASVKTKNGVAIADIIT